MKRKWNWIAQILAVLLVLPAAGCRLPNLNTDDVPLEDENLVLVDEGEAEEPIQLAQAEPEAKPKAKPKAEPEAEPEAGPPAPEAPEADAGPAPEYSRTPDGDDGPEETVYGVLKDDKDDILSSCNYCAYVFAKGDVVRLHNFHLTKDGKKYWPRAKRSMWIFVSRNYQSNTNWFIRPNDTCYCDGSFAMKVPVDATHIVRNGVQFDIVYLDAPYHDCDGNSPICGKTIWDLIQKGEDVAFYMEGEPKKGSSARTFNGFIPVGSDTFIGRDDIDPRSGETRKRKYVSFYDTPTDVWAFPEERMYKGQKTHNIVLKKVGR